MLELEVLLVQVRSSDRIPAILLIARQLEWELRFSALLGVIGMVISPNSRISSFTIWKTLRPWPRYAGLRIRICRTKRMSTAGHPDTKCVSILRIENTSFEPIFSRPACWHHTDAMRLFNGVAFGPRIVKIWMFSDLAAARLLLNHTSTWTIMEGDGRTSDP